MKTIEGEVLELSNRHLELETKRQIYEKVRKRRAELADERSAITSLCPELNPDVIVISDDQSFLFEPQNLQMAEWLQQHFGIETLNARERVRVHPSQCQRIIRELKMAGFEINGSVQS